MNHVLDYEVKAAPDGYEAVMKARPHSVYLGKTEKEALSCMLWGTADLARQGSFDPNDPERVGCPPLQHVMGILTERLHWHLDRRREQADEARTKFPSEEQQCLAEPYMVRQNEVISGLATAIAALARIKEL